MEQKKESCQEKLNFLKFWILLAYPFLIDILKNIVKKTYVLRYMEFA